MAPTTITSLAMVVFALLVLSMSCWAWFGDWEPRPPQPRTSDAHVDAEVEALRHAIEAYEQEQRSR